MTSTPITFTLTPRGPFSLAASIRFLEGFAPARYVGAGDPVLRLAFPLDGRWTPVGLRVRQDADGVVHAQAHSPADPPDGAAVRAQLRRILSLDVDGSNFTAIGERDPVVGGLQRRYPGLRPVTFWSPYEAACWAVISHRIRITQAATVKARLTERLGTPVELPGGPVTAFPGPAELLRGVEALTSMGGLAGRKPEWLCGLAAAALDGRLDAGRLRELPPSEALRELAALPGIGPFSAELILLRGAGTPDVAPRHEPRLRQAVRDAYRLDGDVDDDTLTRISDGWPPYRTWVSLLLRTWREDETGEIAGRRRR
ncbi:DNA-3-methyladenine glycosylase family protein [Micromonospora coerulea]|uniref:DNA-3-methyladenine glycosylase family protein n=1 Tax=Micromonospora coerulea TaxID=47856 RepID=UPI001905167C|nr:DNA-3-methyladenine glycosylase 2 [Micromonospora veneta]